MEKILEALKKLLPADQMNEVASAVEEMLKSAKSELEATFNEKLQEAYSELSGELTSAEKIAEEGYQEAYAIINDLRNRLATQQEEFEQSLEEEYEEAYQMLQAAKAEKNALEVDMYDEYDNKLNQMKQYIVEKVHQFLQLKGAEIYEQAKRDILNDPRMAEHKVALDKIIEVASNYLSDEDYAFATSTKLEEATRQIEELKANIKIMEARNINLDRQCRKMNERLTESVKHNEEKVIAEGKKERVQKAKNVSGRGEIISERVKVIAETVDAAPNARDNHENDTLLESIGLDRETAGLLAGVTKND